MDYSTTSIRYHSLRRVVSRIPSDIRSFRYGKTGCFPAIRDTIPTCSRTFTIGQSRATILFADVESIGCLGMAECPGYQLCVYVEIAAGTRYESGSRKRNDR